MGALQAARGARTIGALPHVAHFCMNEAQHEQHEVSSGAAVEQGSAQAIYTRAFELAAAAREAFDATAEKFKTLVNPRSICAVLGLMAGGEVMAGGQPVLEQGVLGKTHANVEASGKLGGPTGVEANILNAQAQQATGIAQGARAAARYQATGQVPVLSSGTIVPTTGTGGGFLIR